MLRARRLRCGPRKSGQSLIVATGGCEAGSAVRLKETRAPERLPRREGARPIFSPSPPSGGNRKAETGRADTTRPAKDQAASGSGSAATGAGVSGGGFCASARARSTTAWAATDATPPREV